MFVRRKVFVRDSTGHGEDGRAICLPELWVGFVRARDAAGLATIGRSDNACISGEQSAAAAGTSGASASASSRAANPDTIHSNEWRLIAGDADCCASENSDSAQSAAGSAGDSTSSHTGARRAHPGFIKSRPDFIQFRAGKP